MIKFTLINFLIIEGLKLREENQNAEPKADVADAATDGQRVEQRLRRMLVAAVAVMATVATACADDGPGASGDGGRICRCDQATVVPFRSRNETVTWVDVGGVHKTDILEAFGKHFGLHPLLLEDIANTDQRPKLDDYETYFFLAQSGFTAYCHKFLYARFVVGWEKQFFI